MRNKASIIVLFDESEDLLAVPPEEWDVKSIREVSGVFLRCSLRLLRSFVFDNSVGFVTR
jgi:hypothetical protein